MAGERDELGSDPPGDGDAGDIDDHRRDKRQFQHRHDPADAVVQEPDIAGSGSNVHNSWPPAMATRPKIMARPACRRSRPQWPRNCTPAGTASRTAAPPSRAITAAAGLHPALISAEVNISDVSKTRPTARPKALPATACQAERYRPPDQSQRITAGGVCQGLRDSPWTVLIVRTYASRGAAGCSAGRQSGPIGQMCAGTAIQLQVHPAHGEITLLACTQSCRDARQPGGSPLLGVRYVTSY